MLLTPAAASWVPDDTLVVAQSSYGYAGDSYNDDTAAAEPYAGERSSHEPRYRHAQPHKRMVNPGECTAAEGKRAHAAPCVRALWTRRSGPTTCCRHAGYAPSSTACAKLVVALPEPLNCSAVTDPFIASQDPDVCARISCGTSGVLAGFSCTPGNGTLAGTQLTTSTGAQATAGSPASAYVCALKRNADGTAWASMAATCCLSAGVGGGGVSGSGATNVSSLFAINAAGNTTFGGCGGMGGGGGGMRAAGCCGGSVGGGGGNAD